MTDTWTVQEAKAKLSEILRRARAGKPQRIGAKGEITVVATDTLEKLSARQELVGKFAPLPGEGLGSWLVRTSPKGPALRLPSRKSVRPMPFSGKRGS